MADQAAIEAFVDQRLYEMSLRPGTWGSPEAVESACFTLVDVYLKFGRDPLPCGTGPVSSEFIRFASSRMPGRPSSMPLSRWLTDPVHGCREARSSSDTLSFSFLHWAGTQVVQFFIAWKEHLSKIETSPCRTPPSTTT
jgi:hypothetical protein